MTTKVTTYQGCFAHLVDGQGRVMLPAHWRGAGEAFILHLVKTPAPHIVASPDHSGAELDLAGRIAIPDELRQAAGIEQEAIFVGLLGHFAVWSSHAHKANSAAAALCQ